MTPWKRWVHNSEHAGKLGGRSSMCGGTLKHLSAVGQKQTNELFLLIIQHSLPSHAQSSVAVSLTDAAAVIALN